jgi:anaerobic magnesium-protoporphyrin IX monomethyl ester cyclase
MTGLVLNLPHSRPVYRCYRCSINSPAFCLPPLELLYAAGTMREAGMETHFCDAVAERLTPKDTLKRIRDVRPDLVVSILGYEHFTEDVDAINCLRENAEAPHWAVMGYLPSNFPDETLEHLQADMILRFEPEQTLREVIDAMRQNRGLEGIADLAWRNGRSVHVGPKRPRLSAAELEALPLPARDLARVALYREPFLSKPFTSYQAARGCPFGCIYCTSSYGPEYVVRSPAHVVAEIEENRRRLGISHFRFTDDTFAVNLNWTREFSERMVAARWPYEWVCLTRIDLMTPERMGLLRRAGCRRLFVGIESGCQKILDYYHKRYQARQVPEMVANARREGLEVVGYFVVGSPVETEDDYRETVDLAVGLDLDMVSVYPMMPYPGTDSFTEAGEPVTFSLYPYEVRYRDPQIFETARWRARQLMRRVYLSRRFMTGRIKWFRRYPAYTFHAGWEFARWLLTSSKQKRQSLL